MSQIGITERASLRRLLAKVLPGEPELEAFCCDHFPAVKRLFSGGMDRLSKETLLLERADAAQLVQALWQHTPEQTERWALDAFGQTATKDPDGSPGLPKALEPSGFSRGSGDSATAAHGGYDAFLFSSQAPEDQRWRSGVLRPALQQHGLRIIDESLFHLGIPYLRAIEHAIQTSRYTVLVLSPHFLSEGFSQFGSLISQHLTIEEQAYRVISILRQPCWPRLSLRLGTCLDFSMEDRFEDQINLLLRSLVQEPHTMR